MRVPREVLFCCSLLGCFWTPIRAEVIYAATNNQILSFDSSTPGSLFSSQFITGLLATDRITDIDVRPSDHLLYGIAQNGTGSGPERVYTIDLQAALEKLVSAINLLGRAVGEFIRNTDFNPTDGSLRIITTANRNFRLDVDTGTLIEDGGLAYASADGNAGVSPFTLGIGYNNSVAGAAQTTLYGVSVARTGEFALITIDPGNSGTLHAVSPFGASSASQGAFDISGLTGVAYFSTAGNLTGLAPLYIVNLQTGQANLQGRIAVPTAGAVFICSLGFSRTDPRAKSRDAFPPWTRDSGIFVP